MGARFGAWPQSGRCGALRTRWRWALEDDVQPTGLDGPEMQPRGELEEPRGPRESGGAVRNHSCGHVSALSEGKRIIMSFTVTC